MGNSEAKIVDALNNPEDEEKLRQVFESFDADKNGQLDREEWKLLGKYIWQAAIKDARDEIKKEIGQELASTSTGKKVGNILASKAGEHVDIISRDVRPQDIDTWVDELFETADSDRSGGLTFDEFKIFLATAAIQANEEHKAALRKGVELIPKERMTAAGNQLRVSTSDGKTTVITVDPTGAVSRMTIRARPGSFIRPTSPLPQGVLRRRGGSTDNPDDGPIRPIARPTSPPPPAPGTGGILRRRPSNDLPDDPVARPMSPTSPKGPTRPMSPHAPETPKSPKSNLRRSTDNVPVPKDDSSPNGLMNSGRRRVSIDEDKTPIIPRRLSTDKADPDGIKLARPIARRPSHDDD